MHLEHLIFNWIWHLTNPIYSYMIMFTIEWVFLLIFTIFLSCVASGWVCFPSIGGSQERDCTPQGGHHQGRTEHAQRQWEVKGPRERDWSSTPSHKFTSWVSIGCKCYQITVWEAAHIQHLTFMFCLCYHCGEGVSDYKAINEGLNMLRDIERPKVVERKTLNIYLHFTSLIHGSGQGIDLSY